MPKKNIQTILFPEENTTIASELFYKASKNNTYFNGEALVIGKGDCVDFNTYFNAFSTDKWYKYTNISELYLSLQICGRAIIEVFHNSILYGRVNCSLVTRVLVDSNDLKWEEIKIGSLSQVGNFSFKVKAIDDVIVYDGCYSTSSLIERDIRLALLFTTYKREQYIKKNIEKIIGLNDENLFTYIVDNASTLELEKSKYYSVIQNKNVGGAGGFTRGMIQVINEQNKYNFTHCIIMDDDVMLDPRVITRLEKFLEVLKQEFYEFFVAGAMFRSDLTYYQVETSATWNQGIVCSNGHGFDMRDSYNCLKNSFEDKADYAAWWFCVVPIKYIRDDNLAIPLFVFNDDVDYGIRNKASIISINGICTWHDAFETKFSAMRRYYEVRNQLIVNSCNGIELSTSKYVAKIKSEVKNSLYLYKYDVADAMLDGVEDFLKGPKWLASIDAEEYNSAVLKKNTKLSFIDPLTIDYDWYRLCCTITDCDKLHHLVRVITANGYYLSADRDIVLPLYATNIEAGYRARTITYFDEITCKGFVSVRDKKRIKRSIKRLNRLIRRLYKEYVRVCHSYRSEYHNLISKEQWEKIFTI